MVRLTHPARRALVASTLALAACGGDGGSGPSGPQPANIVVAGGNLQSAPYGAPTPVAPSVLVTSSSGPLAGIAVTFGIVAGGGEVEGASAVTNASGVASVGRWILGPAPGPNTLRASAGALSVDISATGTAGSASAIVVVAGDHQEWVANSTVPVRPSVRVTDGAFGVPGVQVTFAVASGGGTVTIPQATTNASGVATVGNWRLGSTGTNTLTASVAGIAAAATFTAEAAPLIVTALNRVSGDAQVGFAGNFAPQRVVVEVLNQYNQPTEGVPVTFTPSASTVAGASVTTGVDGRATLGSWRFGPAGAPGLVATAGTMSTTFTGTATPPPASALNIEVRYLGTTPDAAIRAAFTNAAARWAQVVVGDLPDVALSEGNPMGPATINTGISGMGTITCVPRVTVPIDDIVIYADIRSIDGAGQILGFATPYYSRDGDNSTVAGCMVFDLADMQELEDNGKLQDVILHEMGHVLGIGTHWAAQGLLVGECTSSVPYFTGPSARNAFVAARTTAFPDSIVPVEGEGTCPNGTRDGHWRESVMDNELMTGYIEYNVPNVLSAITAASLRDLGYVVNDAVSDPFAMLRAPGGAARTGGRKVRLHEVDVRAPRILVDTRGTEIRRIMR